MYCYCWERRRIGGNYERNLACQRDRERPPFLFALRCALNAKATTVPGTGRHGSLDGGTRLKVKSELLLPWELSSWERDVATFSSFFLLCPEMGAPTSGSTISRGVCCGCCCYCSRIGRKRTLLAWDISYRERGGREGERERERERERGSCCAGRTEEKNTARPSLSEQWEPRGA